MGFETIDTTRLMSQPDRKVTFMFTDCPADLEDGRKIGYFLEGLFGIESDVPLVPTLKGSFEDSSRNYFFIAEIDGEIVSTCWYIVSAANPEIGALGEVYTVPKYRKLELAKNLCQKALNHFEFHGGQTMLLGSNNPIAIEMYKKMGFVEYPGNLMRYTVDPPDVFDKEYFDAKQETVVREIQHGDIPGIANLIGAPNPWYSVCYAAGVFSFSHQPEARCVSLYTTLKRSIDMGGCWCVIETAGAQRTAGIGTLIHQGNRLNPQSAVMDIFVHPNFKSKACELIDYLVDKVKAEGIAQLRVEILDGEDEKIGIIEKYGFKKSPSSLRQDNLSGQLHNVLGFSYDL
jgi:GNAT superfamily N-acetyltransferase